MPKEALLDESKLDRLNLFATAGTVDKYEVTESDSGSKIVHAVEVFKAGTFKDSMGEQRTWTIEQLAQMVNNYELLTTGGIFPNVPLRIDHSWGVEGVIGYIVALGVSGDRLIADLEITEPDHFEKFDRGTYRSRSLEVGMYEDNNGTIYFPVVMGLAFVDLPAVEGLHRGSHKVGCFSYLDGEENPTVPDKTDTPAPFKFRINGADETDYAKVQNYVSQLEGEKATLTGEKAALEGTNTALTGRVETLETYQREQVKHFRTNYVSGLAQLKKIAATQIASMSELVDLMTDEQFAAFQASYDAAPGLSLLANHGNGTTNPAGEPAPETDEKSVLEETIKALHRSGMTEADVAKTSSYKRLAVLVGAGK